MSRRAIWGGAKIVFRRKRVFIFNMSGNSKSWRLKLSRKNTYIVILDMVRHKIVFDMCFFNSNLFFFILEPKIMSYRSYGNVDIGKT